MPFVEEIVTIVVDGHELRGWQDVSIDRSMQDAVISFAMTATNPSWGEEARLLRKGTEIEVHSTGDLACRGYVDGYGADYGEGKRKVVTLTGRSKGQDSVDGHPVKHKTGRVEKKKLDAVAKEFDEPKVGFRTDQQLDPIEKVQRRPGDTIFQTVEREARRLGLMLMGETEGGILITRAGTKRHAGALVLGESPVQRIGVKLKLDEKFKTIVVKGQRAVGTGKDALRQRAEEKDESVRRERSLEILLEGDAPKKELKKRARWERLRRSGNGTTITATVSTWRDDAGQLWEPSRLMAIVIEEEDIDGDYTLSTVQFRQGRDEGTVAYLTFVDPQAHGGEKAASKGKGLDEGGIKKGMTEPGNPEQWT